MIYIINVIKNVHIKKQLIKIFANKNNTHCIKKNKKNFILTYKKNMI